MAKLKYTAEQFIKAIPGSGGIISTIAARVGCRWETAKKYTVEYPTVKVVYDEECERILDTAESVVYGNITAAAKEQQASGGTVQVDSQDAKWLLSRKAKGRGYVERQEVTGADGQPLMKGYAEISPDDWDDEYDQAD